MVIICTKTCMLAQILQPPSPVKMHLSSAPFPPMNGICGWGSSLRNACCFLTQLRALQIHLSKLLPHPFSLVDGKLRLGLFSLLLSTSTYSLWKGTSPPSCVPCGRQPREYTFICKGLLRRARISAPLQSISHCLDTSCLVTMETLQLWLMGKSSNVSPEKLGGGGEREKGRCFLWVQCLNPITTVFTFWKQKKARVTHFSPQPSSTTEAALGFEQTSGTCLTAHLSVSLPHPLSLSTSELPPSSQTP